MEDDGALSRVSAMSGPQARAEKKVIKLGLRPPIVEADNYLRRLFYLCYTAPIKIRAFIAVTGLVDFNAVDHEMSFPEIAHDHLKRRSTRVVRHLISKKVQSKLMSFTGVQLPWNNRNRGEFRY